MGFRVSAQPLPLLVSSRKQNIYHWNLVGNISYDSNPSLLNLGICINCCQNPPVWPTRFLWWIVYFQIVLRFDKLVFFRDTWSTLKVLCQFILLVRPREVVAPEKRDESSRRWQTATAKFHTIVAVYVGWKSWTPIELKIELHRKLFLVILQFPRNAEVGIVHSKFDDPVCDEDYMGYNTRCKGDR